MKKRLFYLATVIAFSLVFCMQNTNACTPMQTNPGGDKYLLDFDWWTESIAADTHEIWVTIEYYTNGPEDFKKLEIFNYCGVPIFTSTDHAIQYPVYTGSCGIQDFYIRVTDKNDRYATTHLSAGNNCPPDFDLWVEVETNIGDNGVVIPTHHIYVDAWDDENDNLMIEIYEGDRLLEKTFGWGSYIAMVNPSIGDHTYTAVVTDFTNSISGYVREPVTLADLQYRHANAPYELGEKIECEFYDYGGPGLAFNDLDGDFGDQTIRPTENVDIYSASEPDGTPVNGIGWIKAGEWWEYTVSTFNQQEHFIQLRGAAKKNNKRV
ncbi:MAG: hypothetical protein MI922_14570, partial [Bacteroidales bacterium]|nr:hypothetical protein [Bacteroidales bacterium]